ncbi:MAG TPA: molybdenum cofactor biosynthesis protein MoaE [Pyrinomonadaceae bacterium]|nr:molybdenum cofactor biosynthesis protein MoaE [Pyrinomonadaceae bacterium]
MRAVEEPASDELITVRVLFFGAAREIAGHDEVEVTLRAPARAASAFEEIMACYPELRRFGRSLLFAVNQEYAREDREVRAGDELAIFPPVSGGAGERDTETRRRGDAEREEATELDFFELTTEPIDVGSVARRIVPPRCGATVTLDGYVREWTRGRRTLYLSYEAYAQMALSEMRRLGREAHASFEIAHIGIVHRTGRLEIGETSVCIAVSAPHRRAAFEACEWAIRELKRTVPIWKKEFYEDGEVWVEGEGARG